LVSNTPGVLPGALDIMPRLPGMVVNTAWFYMEFSGAAWHCLALPCSWCSLMCFSVLPSTLGCPWTKTSYSEPNLLLQCPDRDKIAGSHPNPVQDVH
jgi:hypothetical protein